MRRRNKVSRKYGAEVRNSDGFAKSTEAIVTMRFHFQFYLTTHQLLSQLISVYNESPRCARVKLRKRYGNREFRGKLRDAAHNNTPLC